jgi:GABA permease
VLSCLNSGLYTASRMAFSLAGRGDAPKVFSATNKRGVPYVAIWISVAFGFLAVIFNYTSPDTVFLFLLNGSGAVALFVWAVIAVSQLRMRRRLEREAPERILVRMWLFPYLTIATILGIAAILVVMLFDHDGRPQVLWSMAVAAVVLIAAFVRHGRSRATEPAMADMH